MATFFMACSKLEAIAIYVVKQACGHDIWSSYVYVEASLRNWLVYKLTS
jgi:hypothetical protein